MARVGAILLLERSEDWCWLRKTGICKRGIGHSRPFWGVFRGIYCVNSQETLAMIRRRNVSSEGQLSLKAEDANLSGARKVSITDMSEGRFNKSPMNMPDCCKVAESRLLFDRPL